MPLIPLIYLQNIYPISPMGQWYLMEVLRGAYREIFSEDINIDSDTCLSGMVTDVPLLSAFSKHFLSPELDIILWMLAEHTVPRVFSNIFYFILHIQNTHSIHLKEAHGKSCSFLFLHNAPWSLLLLALFFI